MSTTKKVIVGVVIAASAMFTLTGCGNDSADVQKCIDKLEQTLQESGSDRALSADEKKACNDETQREFILGE